MTYNLTQDEMDKVKTLVDMIALIAQGTDHGEHKLSFSDKQEEIVLDLVQDIRRFLS